jgi:hypothetical protein
MNICSSFFTPLGGFFTLVWAFFTAYLRLGAVEGDVRHIQLSQHDRQQLALPTRGHEDHSRADLEE